MEKEGSKRFRSIISDYAYKIVKGRQELKKVIIGQDRVIVSMFRAVIANGHVLLEGVPGIAKTLIVKSFAEISAASFKRIQFTPDLLPTDIVGITIYNEKTGNFSTIKGPIFGNFVLSDEINRSPAKVQSALLEAMAERQVTIGRTTFKLEKPFFVLATQNPLESVGTYPLPAAAIDRFLFKVLVDYPNIDDEKEILETNMTTRDFESFKIKPVLSKTEILELQNLVHKIYVDDSIKKYIVRIVDATRNHEKYKIKLGKYIDYGSSPRASIGLFVAAKAEALINSKTYVIPEDVKTVAMDVLRHRVFINYEGQSENIKPEEVIKEILKKVPIL